jgi:hypothetical protein
MCQLLTPEYVKPEAGVDYFAGDLLFFYGTGFQSRAIEAVTWGPSHVGMIFTYHGAPMLIESTTLCDLPCAIRGKPIAGVQAHTPQQRIAAYQGRVFHASIRHGCHFRRDQSRALTETIYEDYLGLPYDMAGALESPSWFLTALRYPDTGSLFCSALCGLLLMDFGKLARENPKRITPAGLLRRVQRQAIHLPPVEITV